MRKSVLQALGSVAQRRKKALEEIEQQIDRLTRQLSNLSGKVEKLESQKESVLTLQATLRKDIEELEALKAQV